MNPGGLDGRRSETGLQDDRMVVARIRSRLCGFEAWRLFPSVPFCGRKGQAKPQSREASKKKAAMGWCHLPSGGMKAVTDGRPPVVGSPGPSAGGATEDRPGREPGFSAPRGPSPSGATESSQPSCVAGSDRVLPVPTSALSAARRERNSHSLRVSAWDPPRHGIGGKGNWFTPRHGARRVEGSEIGG